MLYGTKDLILQYVTVQSYWTQSQFPLCFKNVFVMNKPTNKPANAPIAQTLCVIIG